MEHKIPIKMNVADREILREVLKIITERRLETKSSVWSSLLSSLIRAHPAFAKSGKVVQEKKRRSLLMTLRRRFLLNADGKEYCVKKRLDHISIDLR